MKITCQIFYALALCCFACGKGNPIAPVPTPDKALSGGDATVFDASSQAFEMPIPTLSPDRTRQIFCGRCRV